MIELNHLSDVKSEVDTTFTAWLYTYKSIVLTR